MRVAVFGGGGGSGGSKVSVSALSKRWDNFICVSNESGLAPCGWC